MAHKSQHIPTFFCVLFTTLALDIVLSRARKWVYYLDICFWYNCKVTPGFKSLSARGSRSHWHWRLIDFVFLVADGVR